MSNAKARVCLLAAGIALASLARADGPITLIAPFPPGGSTDSSARILAQTLQQQGGGTFVVENKPGANGQIGAKYVAQSKPDGATWLVIDNAIFSVNPFLYPPDPDFEASRDLKVVRGIGYQPSLLVVNPTTGIKSLKDFVETARHKTVNYASGGIGSAGHLTMEYFGKTAGLKLNHVPYKGGAPAMADLLGGQVEAAFVVLPNALPHVKSGKLVALAVSSKSRSRQLPDVPTVAESGFPGFSVQTSGFVVVPAKVPADVVAAIDAKLKSALADTATQQKIRNLGIEPVSVDGQTAMREIVQEKGMWENLIRENNIKAN